MIDVFTSWEKTLDFSKYFLILFNYYTFHVYVNKLRDDVQES